MKNRTPFGQYLRKLREEHFETIEDMASKFGFSKAYLSAIELGKSTIPKTLPKRLVELYNLQPIDDFDLDQAYFMSHNAIQRLSMTDLFLAMDKLETELDEDVSGELFTAGYMSALIDLKKMIRNGEVKHEHHNVDWAIDERP